ncbi:MAG: glycoside hydrolase family 5 protein [Desulfobacterales bacterium]|nr:glycoside hydrolase family 5 protein [Desulfobacterales bacterium]
MKIKNITNLQVFLKRIFILLSCFLILLLTPNRGFAEKKYLNSDDFKEKIFRGFTVEGEKNKKTDNDFEDLDKIGVEIIRTGLRLDRCSTCINYTISQTGLEYLDWVVSKANEYEMYVVITLVPENPYSAEYWEDKNLQSSIIKIWRSLAERYKNNSFVAGYDLLNEPKPPGNIKNASKLWVDFAEDIISAIREVDTNHIIFFEPAPSASAFAFKALKEPLSDDNIVYSLHMYKHVRLTHQRLGDNKETVTYPNKKFDKKYLSKYLDPIRSFKKKHNVPIYVGEFSCVRWAPDDSAYRWIEDVLDLFETEGWSWTFFSFRGFHGWDHELPSTVVKPKDKISAMKLRSMETPTFQLISSYMNNHP